jgi:hypothetical protein
LLAFTYVYFFQSRLFNGLRPIQIRKILFPCHTVAQAPHPPSYGRPHPRPSPLPEGEVARLRRASPKQVRSRCVDHDLHLARIAKISDLRNINCEETVFQVSDQRHPAAAPVHDRSAGLGAREPLRRPEGYWSGLRFPTESAGTPAGHAPFQDLRWNYSDILLNPDPNHDRQPGPIKGLSKVSP